MAGRSVGGLRGRGKNCGEGEISAADAGTSRGADCGRRWEPWVCADAVDTGAAYPAREGDFEHLYEPGVGCADGHDLSDRVWQGRDSRAGGAQSGEGGLCGEDAECAYRGEVTVCGRAEVP